MRHIPLKLRLLLAMMLSVLLAVTVMGTCLLLALDLRLGFSLSALAALLSAFLSFQLLFRSYFTRLDGLRTGLLNLLDGEFSVSLKDTQGDELGELVRLFNMVSGKLRVERQTLYQRELMLDTVIQNSGLHLLLCDMNGRAIYHSRKFGSFVGAGPSVVGAASEAILVSAPPGLRRLLHEKREGLFDARCNGELRIYHLSVGRFLLHAAEHHLYLIKDMTREITRQEAQVWKETIRVISHELNNTLAPISSMSHSGKVLLQKQRHEQLPAVLDTIAERSEHLRSFVDQYAQVARLPPPQKETTTWAQVIEGIEGTYPFSVVGQIPSEPAHLDKTQIQQLLLNLLKNAAESGSPPHDIHLRVDHANRRYCLQILDRGCGMDSTVLLSAIHPYFSTKAGGSGIGLPLCREIIEAHDGTFSIANREGGGVAVRVEFSDRDRPT